MVAECPSATDQFEELYALYHEAIYRYLYRLVDRTDLAGDLTHDVFIQLHRQLQGNVPLRNPRAWLYRAIIYLTNQCRSVIILIMENQNAENEPQTLIEAIRYFSDQDNCLRYVVARRWPTGVICPTCGRTDVNFLANQRKWQCKSIHPKRQFSAKVGTIFEDSPLGLDKWLPAVWMLTNCKNGVSSYEIHRALKVTQKTAWFMLHRIRLAMQNGPFAGKLGGSGSEVEVDETFIGGAARNMHPEKRERRIRGTGGKDKTAVMGILERGGKIRTKVVDNRRKPLLQDEVRKNVETGSSLYTDSLLSYDGLSAEYLHQVINHAEQYVIGRIHTNGLENFWSLLKRSLNGTYIAVEPFHLFRYLDEQTFRFNNRKDPNAPVHDGERFERVMNEIIGKRLTYAELTGKTGSTTFN